MTSMRSALLRMSVLGLVALLAAPAVSQESPVGGVGVTTLDGRTRKGEGLASISSQEVSLRNGEKPITLPLTEVIVIEFATRADPARQPGSDEVALDLWSGEELHGRILGGDDESLRIEAPLLGKLEVKLDSVAGVRFLARLAREAEPPDLTSHEQDDLIHMTKGDRIAGGVERFAEKGVLVASGDEDPVLVPYSRVTAVRLATFDPEAPEGTALDVVLRDGTRLTGTEPGLAGGRLSLKSHSGFAVSVRLTDVVAAHVRSDAFTYVSDLEPATVKVEPFWKMAAGEPEVLYAPRMDRAFSGRRLTCAKRTWTKGVGVFGGTTLTWKLDGRYKEFRTAVGIDDGAGDLGGVVFEVSVDGKVQWTSGFVRPTGRTGRGQAGPVTARRISLDGAKQLSLRVTTGDEKDPYPIQDEANWLGAMLVR
jgi:NPCBM/NEW2 domain-containing protein